MNSWLQQAGELVASGSPLAYAAALLGGLVTSLNPCVLVTVPVMVGYAGGRSHESPLQAFLLTLWFVLGLSAVFTVLGLMAGLAGRLLGDVGLFWRWAAALVALVMGGQLMGLYTVPFPSLSLPTGIRRGAVGAFLLGALFGMVASPCATPMLAVILTYVAAEGRPVYGGSLLFVYALGHSALLIAAGTLSGAARWITESRRLATASEVLKRTAGVLLIAAGTCLLIDTIGRI